MAEPKTKARDRITIVWTISDVIEVRPDLNDDQCRDVLANVKRNHDAEAGVNWDTIKTTADILFPEA